MGGLIDYDIDLPTAPEKDYGGSPDLDEIVNYSDRILVLYAGHVYEIPDASATNIDELGRLIGGDFARTEPTL